MNKNKIIGIFSAFLMTINISCNTENDPYEDLPDIIVQAIKRCKNFKTFQDGMVWDEVTYISSNPSQYILNHYEVIADTLSDGTVRNNLFKDSQNIGTISKDDNGKVYFTKTGSSIPILLYDFSLTDIRSGGLGHCNENLYLTQYADLLQIRDRITFPISYYSKYYIWDWMYDMYGGITINSVGSTAGILSPIIPVNSGFKCEVLQVYNKKDNFGSNGTSQPWANFEYNGMAYNIFHRYFFYINFESELLYYVPFNIWKSPAIFLKLYEQKLITKEDYDTLIELDYNAKWAGKH